jgi:DNA-binding NarL/FixJ family response regulator
VTRVLVIADHQVVADRIRLALRETVGFELVGFADGRRPVRDVLVSSSPDVVVVVEMSERSQALARLAEVASTLPWANAVLLASDMGDPAVTEILAAGATTVIAQAVEPVTFALLLREAASGNIVRQLPESSHSRDAVSSLSDRELEILRYVAMGLTNVRIASELWLTKNTVKFHLSNTYRKLGVANRTQASRFAHMHHLLAPADGPAPSAGSAHRSRRNHVAALPAKARRAPLTAHRGQPDRARSTRGGDAD